MKEGDSGSGWAWVREGQAVWVIKEEEARVKSW